MPEKPRTKATPANTKAARQANFLARLMLGDSVADAAAYAGVNRRTAYEWKEDPKFSQVWDDTIKEREENMLAKYESELHERALDRSDKNSHILLIFLLKKLNAEYKENYKREVKVTHESVKEIAFSDEDWSEAMQILQSSKPKKAKKIPASDEVLDAATDDNLNTEEHTS